uniref:Putative ovule protein n=1 Tax=Solanum chacoense TaxID=4108 RepID=A0A0V0HCQ7_SOLCH
MYPIFQCILSQHRQRPAYGCWQIARIMPHEVLKTVCFSTVTQGWILTYLSFGIFRWVLSLMSALESRRALTRMFCVP